MFDNLGWYYEPNIGVSFNSIEFRKRLLEFFFSEKWIEFTPDILIFYPHFLSTFFYQIKTIWLQRYMHHLIAKVYAPSDCKENFSLWQELHFSHNCNHTIKKKSSSLTTAFYRRPQIFIGDPKFIIGDPKLFIIIHKFSLETPRFS